MTARLAVLLIALLAAGCSGAFGGGTIFGGNPTWVSVPYLTHCASCHGTSTRATEAALFSREWRQRADEVTFAAEASPARMGRLLDAYLVPSHPPHGLSDEDARAIRMAIVCHHYPKSATCHRNPQ